MPIAPTNYPFRQALTLALRRLIVTAGVPAINAELSALMTAQGYAPGRIPAFSDSTVIAGDKNPVSEPTLCIVGTAEQNQRLGTEGLMYCTFATQIQIKTPQVGDDAPEDFLMFGSVCIDNLRDLLTNHLYSSIVPQNRDGARLLPAGMNFQDCYYLGSQAMNFPNRQADGVTYTRGWIVRHTASISFYQQRPGALGSP